MLTREEEIKILDALEVNEGNYQVTSQHTHYTERKIRFVDMKYHKKFGYTAKGKGRKNLQKHIVAIRDSYGEWDQKDRKIIQAIDDYENGLVELCQGRDGLNIIMYAIPRKKKVERKEYFYKRIED